jgi:hypothetical protein
MQSDQSPPPLIPGFDFLKNLAGQAGLGGFKQWVAPTLDPEELEKRIEELRTVQFWLEQNARMLGATIQALEVQKMTLSTLRSMNVPMPDLQQVLGAMAPPGSAGPSPGTAAGGAAAGATARGGAGLVDPMKWWGDLTAQFQSLAAQAMAAAPGASSGASSAGKASSPAHSAGRQGGSSAQRSTNTGTSTSGSSRAKANSKPGGRGASGSRDSRGRQ